MVCFLAHILLNLFLYLFFHISIKGFLISISNVDAQLNCNFDVDFCGWSNPTANNLKWIRTQTQDSSPNTSPPGDHTLGSIYFVLIFIKLISYLLCFQNRRILYTS